MDTSRGLAAAICVILAGATIPPCALGQSAPAADFAMAGNGEGALPPVSGAMVDPAPSAGFSALGFGQSAFCRWTASAEFVALERVGTVPHSLVETVPNSVPYTDLRHTPGTEVLNASDLHHGFSGGLRLGLIHHGDDGTDLEVSYLQIDGWGAERAIGPTPNDWLVMRAPGDFLQTQTNNLFLEQSMAWDYTSRLYNAEVNMRWHPWDRVTVLAGFRWLNLTEELAGNLLPTTTQGGGTFWDTQTKNNLYGLQIGADTKLLERGRFSIDSVAKAGLYDNHVDEISTVRMLRLQYSGSDSTDHLAFVGQIGVQCKYRFTPRLTLKAGYEAMWLEGVALAPGQISKTNCNASLDPWAIQLQPLGVHCSSGVFYHGATAGLEYSF